MARRSMFSPKKSNMTSMSFVKAVPLIRRRTRSPTTVPAITGTVARDDAMNACPVIVPWAAKLLTRKPPLAT